MVLTYSSISDSRDEKRSDSRDEKRVASAWPLGYLTYEGNLQRYFTTRIRLDLHKRSEYSSVSRKLCGYGGSLS